MKIKLSWLFAGLLGLTSCFNNNFETKLSKLEIPVKVAVYNSLYAISSPKTLETIILSSFKEANKVLASYDYLNKKVNAVPYLNVFSIVNWESISCLYGRCTSNEIFESLNKLKSSSYLLFGLYPVDGATLSGIRDAGLVEGICSDSTILFIENKQKYLSTHTILHEFGHLYCAEHTSEGLMGSHNDFRLDSKNADRIALEISKRNTVNFDILR